MSTPQITAPTGDLELGVRRGGRSHAGAALKRFVRGREIDPPWSRPSLLAVAALAGVLMTWSLTRSGYANTYYASAASAASHSWWSLLFNAVDSSGYVSIDKGPLSVWMMGLSGRILGFSSFSMLLPSALCGVASVLVLHNTVKRTLGARAGILAALVLALTPVTVVISRFNNPDALLALMLVCSAWALVRALESGRTRHLILCGALVGLAFNTKMLQAYLVVPALTLTFLIAGRGSVRRRLAQLLAGGASMFAVSFAWFGAMMLVPAADRPFVGDTTSNSWFDLIFGANGLSRVTGNGSGGPGGGAFGGSPGLLRLFNDQVGGQIAWLLPLAAVGLVLGLWITRRAPRTDRMRAAYLLWGLWALVHFLVFSLSQGLFHPYYTSALAPAVAALAGGGLAVMWQRSRESRPAAWASAAAVLGTALLAMSLLARADGFVPWLRWVILALAIAAVAELMVPRRLAARPRRTPVGLAAAAGLTAILAGPTAYSLATVGQTLGGGNPLAGPTVAQSALGGFGGLPGPGARPGAARSGLLRGPLAGGSSAGPLSAAPPAGLFSGQAPPLAGGAPRGLAGGGADDKALISYLEAHRRGAKYLVAGTGSQTAAPIALASGQAVVTVGGFMGSDPAPTVAQLQTLIRSGQLRYVLLEGGPGAAGRPGRPGRLGGAGGAPGAGGPGGSESVARARESWVTSHCTAVRYGSSAASSGSAQGTNLYDCSRAA